ncbi:hypothetical protein DBR43_30035 [Pedobacter sp. KBW06]|uniref:hypothetical protein n=1 Tax=Pedobacter sp. KBW06 TaxID=2153359 RepID=UPI000F5A8C6A|nr:hypothetical protein [Pedobacter sp. KBW06]RQO66449.1 hypothetical protein DBR43_30035 [Pedobacter sp. KBW06]
MTPFKPRFNIFIPSLRLTGILVGLNLLIFMISGFIENIGFEELKHKEVYLFAVGILAIGFSWVGLTVSFLKKTRNYTITDTFIKKYNFLNFSNTYYYKNDVKGFSTCKIRTRHLHYEMLTIYLCDDTKIDLEQFAYFNFSRIQFELYEKGYDYLGEEDYVPNFFGREYQF